MQPFFQSLKICIKGKYYLMGAAILDLNNKMGLKCLNANKITMNHHIFASISPEIKYI